MEINNIQPAAVETLSRPEAVRREPETRPENTEPTRTPQTTAAVQVEISAEARAMQDADEAALQRLSQQQTQAATYTSSGEIGG